MTQHSDPRIERLAGANLLAQSAEQIALAAAPLIAVFAFAAGATETGLLQAVLTLPFLLFALPFGLLADRRSRRSLTAGAETVRAVSLVLVLVVASAGWLNLPLLAVLGFIGTCGTVMYNVATPGLVQGLLPRDRLAEANGRLELARSLAFAAGPALGGLLVGWVGANAAYGVAAALSLSAAVLMARLPEPAPASAPAAGAASVAADLREGAAFVAFHPIMRPITVTAVLFNAGFFVLQAVYVVHASTTLALAASEIGLTLAAYGVGMVAGALVARPVMARLPLGRVILIGPACGLISAALMAATIVVPSIVLATLSFFLIGLGPILWTIATTTLRQVVTPAHLQGRVSAVLMMATFGARPLGAALAAGLAAWWGVAAALLAALLFFAGQFAAIALSPVPTLRRLDDAAASARDEREVPVSVRAG